MNFSSWLFWNVDTQNDFVEPDGKLYVEGAEKLKQTWRKLTELARKKSIRVVNTADYHYFNSAELDENPDFVKTFPQHCMAKTEGAEYVEETMPEEPVIFDWNKEYLITPEIIDPGINRNFIVRKDAFDVFKGNPLTKYLVKMLKPKNVVIYGVTTNVCVDAAVMGLSRKVKNVYVVEDAIKELPNIPLPFEKWKKRKVKMLTYNELEKMLD